MHNYIIRRLTNLIALAVSVGGLSGCGGNFGVLEILRLVDPPRLPDLLCQSASYSLGRGTCVALTNRCLVPGFPQGQWAAGDNLALYGLPEAVQLETDYPASLPPERRLCAGDNALPVANHRVDYLYSRGRHFGPFNDSPLFITVTETDLSLAATASESVVSPGATILLSAVISGGTLPYTFSWQPATDLQAATAQFIIASPTVTTTYTVTVFDSLGQRAEASVTVTVTDTPPPPLLAVVDLDLFLFDDPDPVRVNDPLTYTVIVNNFGLDPATGVVMTATFHLDADLATPSQGSCTNSFVGDAIFVNCSLGTLASGASATVTITGFPFRIGTITNNIATVNANESDTKPRNNTETEDTTVIP
jgi:hypothetical protein